MVRMRHQHSGDRVDVLLPLYLAATAISSGAYDRLLHRRCGSDRRRYGWKFELEERTAFPAPRGGTSPVGFPGRIPAPIALAGPRPAPSTTWVYGRDLARKNCRPERLVESVWSSCWPTGATRTTPSSWPKCWVHSKPGAWGRSSTATLTTEVLAGRRPQLRAEDTLGRGLEHSDHAPKFASHTCTSVRSHPVEPLDSFRGD